MSDVIKDPLLTEGSYYSAESDRKYMSPSLYKQFANCEHRAMALLNRDYVWPPSPAMVIGQYVEARLLGEDPEAFAAAHPEMFVTKLEETDETIPMVAQVHPELVTSGGRWKSGALSKARELMPEAFTLHSRVRSEYEVCESVISRAQRDAMFMGYLTDGDHQTVLSGRIGGADWKGKTDTINLEKRRIVDLKVMRDMQRRGGRSFIEVLRYDEQLAVYAELARQMYGGDWECYIAIVTKETPSGICLAKVPDWRIAELLGGIDSRMPHVSKVWHGEIPPVHCGVCDYCRDTNIITEAIDSDLVGMSTAELLACGAI